MKCIYDFAEISLHSCVRCILTGPNQQRWSTALEVERVQCNQGINQEDYTCIEPASAGAGVNTKVCLYSFKICSSWNDENPSGQGWAGALACPDSSGRWMAVATYYSASNSPPVVMTSLLGLPVREATKQLIRRGLAMPRY